MDKIKIVTAELQELLGKPIPIFPKYATQLINLANQNAQGTRPKIVGQLSELIQSTTARNSEEWETWYLKHHPDAIGDATERIYSMMDKLRESLAQIDRSMVEAWVRDLVLTKTFVGLRFQEAILKRVAEAKELSYRLANPDEEARGIDGLIGDIPVSIKPDSYQAKSQLPEKISVGFIYYTKVKDGIVIEYDL